MLPTSNRMTNGEMVPGGMKARERVTNPFVSAIACAISVPGWKYNFIRATPWMLRLST